MSENTPNSKDEIDLGQVLKSIGNFFQKILDLLKTLAIAVFNLIISLLLIVKKNILKFIIVGVASFLVGFLVEKYEKPMYFSTMIVQPNFNSTSQLYSDMRYYDGLTATNDSIALANTFGITQSEASSLGTIFIQPIRDENELLTKYDFFKTNLADSADVPDIGFQRFKLNINPTEFATHMITVESTDPYVFKKMEDSIIKGGLSSNKYLHSVRNKELRSYILKEEALKNQEEKIDSLSLVYKNVMLKNAEKVSSSGTSIQMASNQSKTHELELFKLERQINDARLSLNTDKALKDDMINIVSGFQKRGKQIETEFIERKAISYFIYGILALFLFIFLKNLNNFLNNYNNKK